MMGHDESARPNGRRPSGVGALALCAILFNALAMVSCGGCATTIVPPSPVNDPVAVYIADYGRHSSIVLPRSEHVLVEYTYGEWQWYALNDGGVLGVIRALFLPSRGALGRRHLDAQPGVEWWEELGLAAAHEVLVEREDAEALLARLDAQWEQAAETRHYNHLHDLDFVHHPQTYLFINNSNPTAARWLRQMGAEVRGPALLSKWRVAE